MFDRLALEVIDTEIAFHRKQSVAHLDRVADLERRRAVITSGDMDVAPGAPSGPVAGITWPLPLDTIVLTDGCWMTIGQAARFIHKSECTIRRHRHEIGVKLGGTWWINRTRMVAYFAAKAQ